MTLVEFFDDSPIENLLGSITYRPDKVIFVGEKSMMRRHLKCYRAFLSEQNIRTEIECVSQERHNLPKLVETLSHIVETNDRCLFDLTGGEDLPLVAMGIVFERYKDKNIQLQRYNIRNGNLYDCDNDGVLLYTGNPQLSVDENIRIHGGRVIYESEKPEGTHLWDFNDGFIRDINTMWDICRGTIPIKLTGASYPRQWNTAMNCLADFERYNEKGKQRTGEITVVEKEAKIGMGRRYELMMRYIRVFEKYGLLTCTEIPEASTLTITFKDRQVYKALSKAGNVLELKTYLLCRTIENFNDVATGVYLDWDYKVREEDEEIVSIANEIDVIAMKGLVPVFISCKCGTVNSEELYKLSTVTGNLGGKYAKKLLVATDYGLAEKPSQLAERARAMNIGVIDYVHKMSDEEFRKAILSELSRLGVSF